MAKSKQTKKKSTNSFLNKLIPNTAKKMLVFVITSFVLVGAGVFAYQSFAASNYIYVHSGVFQGGNPVQKTVRPLNKKVTVHNTITEQFTNDKNDGKAWYTYPLQNGWYYVVCFSYQMNATGNLYLQLRTTINGKEQILRDVSDLNPSDPKVKKACGWFRLPKEKNTFTDVKIEIRHNLNDTHRGPNVNLLNSTINRTSGLLAE